MCLAYLYLHLGDFTKALHAARQVLQLQPSSAEAYQLALDLAFRAHAWGTVNELTSIGQAMIPRMPKIHGALQWWTTQHPEGGGRTVHG
jgi:hypothetical protein